MRTLCSATRRRSLSCTRARCRWQCSNQDVIAVSYLAKRCGVHKRMLPAEARSRLSVCGGKLVHVPTDSIGRVTYRLYEDWSRQLFALWRELAVAAHPSAVVEIHASSKEEAWIDLGLSDGAAALAAARRLRAETRARLGFDVSVGLAWCKSYAKLASLAAKPPGTGVVAALRAEEVRALLGSAPIERLPRW